MIIKVNVTESGALAVKQRDANIALKKEYEAAIRTWHRKHRPKHFEAIAFRRYRYTPRSRKYEKWKKKKYGHRLPLVRSGESRLLSQVVTRVSSTPRSAAITMPVRVFNFKPRGSRINMREEFQTFADVEINEYETQMTAGLDRRIRKFKQQKRKYG